MNAYCSELADLLYKTKMDQVSASIQIMKLEFLLAVFVIGFLIALCELYARRVRNPRVHVVYVLVTHTTPTKQICASA